MNTRSPLPMQAGSLARSLTGRASPAIWVSVFATALLALVFPSLLQPDAATYAADLQAQRLSSATAPVEVPRGADFGAVTPSADARRLANWVAISGDSEGAAFVLIDKREAQLYAFDGQARLLATSPVLLGSALGDETVPGIGDRPIALVRPEERTTPAGRFVAERGRNARGEDVVWVDYDAAVSIHRVVTANPSERRLDRLASLTKADNRISYGCINLPAAFYDSHIRPAFARQTGIVYILPDVATMQQVFGL